MVDVEANAPGASGRARINGLIGLLLRPCKAKGRRARRITQELAYCLLSTFPLLLPSPFSILTKGMVLLHIHQSGHGLGRLDTPDVL